LHGEAVAVGMICASRLAERLGLAGPDVRERQLDLLQAFSLPTKPLAWSIDELIEIMRTDKKAVAGRMRFVLPLRIGAVALIEDVPEAEVRTAIQECM
jgi:3-dehydroquinate synthase